MKVNDPKRDKKTISLLKQYDTIRHNLRYIERELIRECTEYGLRRGVWGFKPDHLRIQIKHQEGEAA